MIVTSGALAAANIVLRACTETGDRVVLESPTYPNLLEVVRRTGRRALAYPLPPAGWQPADFGRLLRQAAPRLAYLVPEHHNPTGGWMSESVRAAMADRLNAAGVQALIDETLVELRLDGQPARTPLAALIPGAITVGSASKTYWGGLRVGWIRSPRPLVHRLIEARAALDLGTAPLEQLTVVELLADADVLAGQLHRLARRRDHLLQRLAAELPAFQVRRPGGGLSVWAELPAAWSSRLARAAETAGVVVTPGHRFFVDGGGDRWLRLPYTLEPQVLSDAVHRLARAWQEVAAAPAVSAPAGRAGKLIA